MGIQDLILAVKRQETPTARALYRLGKAVKSFEVPAPRAVVEPLYYAQQSARNAAGEVARLAWNQPLFRARCASVGQRLNLFDGLPYIYGHLAIHVGDDCAISGHTSFVTSKVFDDPVLRMGDRTYIGWMVTISAAQRVELGCDVKVANGVFITDNPGHPLDAQRRRTQPVGPEDVRPVRIEDDVWLGTNVVVLPGVTIGARTVVGAGAVVTRDLPPDVLAAGNPAKVIRPITPEDRATDA